jgi:hypothetical protein
MLPPPGAHKKIYPAKAQRKNYLLVYPNLAPLRLCASHFFSDSAANVQPIISNMFG